MEILELLLMQLNFAPPSIYLHTIAAIVYVYLLSVNYNKYN